MVRADDPLFVALHEDGRSGDGNHMSPTQCDYEIKYADGASTIGALIVDQFSLPRIATRPNLPFGNYYSPGSATLYFDRHSLGMNPMDVIKGGLSSTSLEQVSDPSLPLCWKGQKAFESVSDVKKEFKSLQLNFGNNAVMEIPPENFLIVTEYGNVCLGILHGSRLNFNIIGDITMQDQMVIYDNEREQLGWIRGSCAELIGVVRTVGSRLHGADLSAAWKNRAEQSMAAAASELHFAGDAQRRNQRRGGGGGADRRRDITFHRNLQMARKRQQPSAEEVVGATARREASPATGSYLAPPLCCIGTEVWNIQLCTLGSLQLTGYIENFQIEHKEFYQVARKSVLL
ncbi:hypothetical protein OsI_35378 [Oryza sativa Indica Group]|uniref:Peptidase A1 domain-containing protein n=1 Tax=Oryza sativa subsp. indica TaxID=39946 RepID=B8BJH3_ORYSI|nr:hypothetical protein OsI_35378 [Oryza sativa Indica Group]